MKRKGLLLALAAGLLAGWMMHRAGWLSRSPEEAGSPLPTASRPVDPLRTSAGWIYRQHQPHHWRYVLLEQK